MKHRISCAMTAAFAGLVLVAVSVPGLLAGPPLTCFPFQIGDARSLPWSTSANQRDWNAPMSDYDTRRLADDTLMLLGEQTPVIVRMETIRRAALYGLKDAAAAQELLARLKARALKNEKGKGNALYLFDYGYLAETYKQASLHQGDKKGFSSSSGENGYARVLEALALRGNDPEMEFAAALITVWPRQERHQEHFRKAVTGAAGDALLTDNLVSHFPDRGASLTELRASVSR
jgi:hypothetical protein